MSRGHVLQRLGRRGAWAIALIAGVAALAWGALVWHDWLTLESARKLVESRRYRPAREALGGLVGRDPGFGGGEAAYLLGLSEEKAGRVDAAEVTYGRVPDRSSWSGRASLAQARLYLKRHRFAKAEPLLRRAMFEPGETGFEGTQTLAHILKIQGRWDEVIAIQEDCLDRPFATQPILRELWRLKAEAYPATEFATGLEQARAAAPQDARVRLGLAWLAIRTGRLADADGLLAECEQLQPGDAAVLRAGLEWAIAAKVPEGAGALLGRISPADRNAADWLRALAWTRGEFGDHEGERDLLIHLDTLHVANGRDLERLSELAHAAGKSEEYETFRGRKAEWDAAQTRYHELLKSEEPSAHAAELSTLALVLGWPREAAGWEKLGGGRGEASEAGLNLDRAEGLGDAARLAYLKYQAGDRTSDGELTGARRGGWKGEIGLPPVPRFELASGAGALEFRFDNGATQRKQLPETMSGGVGLLDFDEDGWLDVYAVQGGVFPPRPGAKNEDRLYRNRGDGTFEDVSAKSGIASFAGGYGFGVAVGDVNNDSHLDLFVTRWRSYALYLNQGDGTFRDGTEAWGLAGARGWPTSAALADFDGDGDLDLYVCHYVAWDEVDPPVCRSPSGDRLVYCPPATLPGEADHLFRNEGDRFTDVTAEAGVEDGVTRGLGVLAADMDGDGLVDYFVANDMNRNLFFRNLGAMRFQEEAELVGLASNSDGGYLAGMGVAGGDVDRDGLLDLAVTNFYGESTRLYRNLGRGQFADQSAAMGVAGPSRYLLGFGAAFSDMNNDGYCDLMTVNGHVDDLRPTVPYAMPVQLLLGSEAPRFHAVAGDAVLGAERVARGLAIGDLNNDGWMDAVLVDQGGPVEVLINRGAEGSAAFVTLKLLGVRSNRDAVGARVELQCAHQRQVGWRVGGASYLSANDARMHFGLPCACANVQARVRWPSGLEQTFGEVPTGAGWLLTEGVDETRRMVGYGEGGGPD